MSNQYQAAAEVLKGAIAALNAILTKPEDEMHRIKITQTLQREADYLVLVTGAGDVTENKGSVLGPATTIGGKAIAKLPRITERELRPSDDKVLDLKEQVESALVYFGPDADSAGILANLPDIVIRGVAKKAGLQVTKQKPEILTVEFVDQIKTAVAAQNEKIELTEEEKEYLGNPLMKVGVGGIKEAHNIPAEDIAPSMGVGVVTVDDPLADETKPQPTSEQTKAFMDETIPNRVNPKDETKKKQAGK
jgi:hypothetical protein